MAETLCLSLVRAMPGERALITAGSQLGDSELGRDMERESVKGEKKKSKE